MILLLFYITLLHTIFSIHQSCILHLEIFLKYFIKCDTFKKEINY